MTLVCQAAGYEEVTYDDLINRINQHKKTLDRGTDSGPFDDVKIHTSFGYVNSFTNVSVQDKTSTKYQSGLQISVGVDLFSENWFAETSFRNFGMSRYGSEELFLKELDLKLGYQAPLSSSWGYRFQGGLANRSMSIKDGLNGVSIEDSSPMVMGAAGLNLKMGKYISLGLDLSARSALLKDSADRSSFDFTLSLGAKL